LRGGFFLPAILQQLAFVELRTSSKQTGLLGFTRRDKVGFDKLTFSTGAPSAPPSPQAIIAEFEDGNAPQARRVETAVRKCVADWRQRRDRFAPASHTAAHSRRFNQDASCRKALADSRRRLARLHSGSASNNAAAQASRSESRVMKHRDVKFGEWVKPALTGYRMECCKCGAVHAIDFKITVAAAAIGDATKTSHAIGPFDDFEMRARENQK
jgi:hypothetical protein